MNSAHFHLLVNHIPILATFFSIAVLGWGMVAKSDAIKKVALVGFLVAGLSVIAAYQSGEEAEDIVENIPAVTHDSIEAHEEAADLARWLTIILGLGGAAGLFIMARKVKGVDTLLLVLMLYSLIVAASLAYTAYEGGLIRHPEIEDASAAGVPSQEMEED